jgi:hypothetical protein
MSDSPHINPITPAIHAADLKNLIKETSNLFLIWCCFISFLGATALIYFFYHSLSAIIIGAVGFLYIWIFLTAKLDELANAIHYKIKPIAYLSLLIPMIGTIFCFQHLLSQSENLLKQQHAR